MNISQLFFPEEGGNHRRGAQSSDLMICEAQFFDKRVIITS